MAVSVDYNFINDWILEQISIIDLIHCRYLVWFAILRGFKIMSSKPVRIEFTLNEGRGILISLWGHHLLNMTSPHWFLDLNQAPNHITPDILKVCKAQINSYDWLNIIINKSTTSDNTSPPQTTTVVLKAISFRLPHWASIKLYLY